jgi:serine acetyltransferase
MIKTFFQNTRVKSFLWRTGMMILAVLIQQAIALLTTLQLDPTITVVLGLVLGEISKAIANALKE